MKRIGILTYHRSHNYGAFMQAYSLSTKLITDFPDCDVKIIDYISEEVYLMYHPSVLNYTKRAIKAPTFKKKLSYAKQLFELIISRNERSKSITDDNFEKSLKLLPLTEEKIISDDLDEIVAYINNNFDIIVVGSDAVWNWQIRRFPNVYFLGKEIKVYKFSYAASSYGQPFRELTEHQVQYLKKAWISYNYIGVRDKPTEEFVSSIVPQRSPSHNCDPTVILDMQNLPVNNSQVLEKLKKNGFDPQKKTIGLMAQKWLFDIVKDNMPEGYQIVSLFNYHKDADVNALDLTPFEWTVAFSFFDITITHYFHGNLLSLKNSTPTLVVEKRNEYNQDYNSKIRDFMSRIGLLDYCFYEDELLNDESISVLISHVISDKDYLQKIINGLESEAQTYQRLKEELRKVVY